MPKIGNACRWHLEKLADFQFFDLPPLIFAPMGIKIPYLRIVNSMYKVAFLGFALTTCIGVMDAQKIVQPKQLDYSSAGILYSKERSLELRPHTNGGSIGVHFGKITTYYKTKYYLFDIGILRHPKEYRQSITFNTGSPFTQTSNSFTYGKQNQLIVLRGGVGKLRYFSDKAKRKGVALGISYEFGASVGFLKPYYLNVSRLESNGFEDYVSTEHYSEGNREIFLDNTKIVGPASFFKGFGEVTAMPGLHGRIGTVFSLGAFEQYVKAFEMGIMIDAYFQRVPIMIVENNTPVFINGYISFRIGKRQ